MSVGATVVARRHALALLRACHPAPTLAVTVVAVLLGVGVHLEAHRLVLFGAAILTGQLSIGWSNDRLDAARDRSTGRLAKPAATGEVPLSLVTTAAVLALLATVAFSCSLGWRTALAALTGVAAGWAYNLGLKSTVWSGATYLLAFAGLAAGPYLALPGNPNPPWWAPTAAALLGFGAHFANVLPDLSADAATGIRGLPQRLGRRTSILVMAIDLCLVAVVLALGGANSITQAASIMAIGFVLAGAAAALALRRPDSAAAFRATIALALLDVLLFVTLIR